MISFQTLGLDDSILKAIEELGFQTPTPVQAAAIPEILKGNTDLIALAQTGTGKTAAFGLPIIQLTDKNVKGIQTLILCPTRELCIQITKDIENYTKYNPWFKSVAIYGGASTLPQVQALRAGCHLVVGTPGRVVDLIERRALKVDSIKWLVLDESDEMLNMGFKEDLDTILSQTPAEKTTYLFSATMPHDVRKIASQYMENPFEITMDKVSSGAVTVSHEYYMVHAKDRYESLKRLADNNPNIYGIVFCRTRMETKEIADELINDGYNADALHGDLSQAQRDHVMHRFRTKNLQLLVATDVAARGIDVDDLTHIINYKLPDDLETYIHRSGRTGRAGKTGICISIIHAKERNKIKDLERITGKKFKQKMVPNGMEICEKKLFNIVDTVEKIEVNHEQIDTFLPVIFKKLEHLEREELIKHFVSVEFNRFLDYYKNSKDLNVVLSSSEEARSSRGEKWGRNDRDSRGRGDRNDRSFGGDRRDRNDRSPGERSGGDRNRERMGGRRDSNTKFSRFHLNVGSRDDLTAPKVIGLINDNTNRKNIEIGKIEILKNFSFFEVDAQHEEIVKNSFSNASFDGRPVTVELSKPDPRNSSEGRGDYPRKSGGEGRSEYPRRAGNESNREYPRRQTPNETSGEAPRTFLKSKDGVDKGAKSTEREFNKRKHFDGKTGSDFKKKKR